jgi:hypothetical protein
MTANGARVARPGRLVGPGGQEDQPGVAVGNVHFGILVAGPTNDLAGAGPAADGDDCYVLHCPEGFTPYTLPGIGREHREHHRTLTPAQVLNGFVNSAPAGAITLTCRPRRCWSRP